MKKYFQKIIIIFLLILSVDKLYGQNDGAIHFYDIVDTLLKNIPVHTFTVDETSKTFYEILDKDKKPVPGLLPFTVFLDTVVDGEIGNAVDENTSHAQKAGMQAQAVLVLNN